jgi:hypothetical protein
VENIQTKQNRNSLHSGNRKILHNDTDELVGCGIRWERWIGLVEEMVLVLGRVVVTLRFKACVMAMGSEGDGRGE